MATAARKMRKTAHRLFPELVPAFQHPTKTPTPLKERAFVTQPVRRKQGDATPAGYDMYALWAPRSAGRIKTFLESGGTKR